MNLSSRQTSPWWVVNTSPVSCRFSPAASRSPPGCPARRAAPGLLLWGGRGFGGTVRSWCRRGRGIGFTWEHPAHPYLTRPRRTRSRPALRTRTPRRPGVPGRPPPAV